MVHLEYSILVQFSLENINFYYSEFTIYPSNKWSQNSPAYEL